MLTESSIKTPAELLLNEGAHPIALDLLLLKKYGPEWLGWEIETTELHLRADYKVADVPDMTMEKLQACKTLHLVDSFWLQWEVFLPCVSALNGLYPDFKFMQAPSVAECMFAVDCANRIREDVAWSDEVKKYLGVIHRWDDILCVQAPLDFVDIDTEGLPLDCAKVAELWPEARKRNKAPDDGSIEAAQIERMLEAHDYLEEGRALLEQQIRVLK